ncbi:MAG: hypothetical protein ABIL09_20410, partial [Gemmatimonadota bacterium]
MVPRGEGGGLWIIWPKQAAGTGTDLTQAAVRQLGLAAGLADFRIAAVDATWSGLRFTERRRDREPHGRAPPALSAATRKAILAAPRPGRRDAAVLTQTPQPVLSREVKPWRVRPSCW